MRRSTPSNLLCLDTSYLVGLFDEADLWHTTAQGIHLVLRQYRVEVCYLDCVFNELFIVLARRCRQRARPEVFPRLMDQVVQAIPDTALTWLYPYLPGWYNRCLGIMRETDGHLNFHDALIVVAAQELGLSALVSFDAGFDQITTMRRLGSPEEVVAWLNEH